MKLSIKAYVALGAVALALPVFQNCSGTKFSDGTSSSDSTASAASVALPGGSAGTVSIPSATGGTPLAATSPEAAGVCYDITCESDAGGFKTIHGTTNTEGVLSTVAPTTGSGWVVAVNSSHQVYSSLNCYPDQLTGPSAPTPTFYSAGLCTDNAPAITGFDQASFPSGVSFAQGKGRYLSQCALTPCGYMTTDTYSDGNGFYEWAAAGYSASSAGAAVKLRVRDYANHVNGGTPFGVDASVPKGQCVVQSASLSTGAVSYQFCLSNSLTLQVVTPQHTFSLSLQGLTPLQ